MSRRRQILFCCAIACAVACGGCGDARPGRPVARLAGTATYEGHPVASGGVSFSPQNGGKAVWAPFDKGRYVADGVAVGPVLVKIHAMRATGKNLGRSEVPEFVSIAPDRYRQGVLIEVAGDKLDLDFDLSE